MTEGLISVQLTGQDQRDGRPAGLLATRLLRAERAVAREQIPVKKRFWPWLACGTEMTHQWAVN